MCGIDAYVGFRDAVPVILHGLEKLEYRGYDSAGIAYLEDGALRVLRAQGKLSNLKALVDRSERVTISPLAIGHTRWATHGKPSTQNAHPHTVGRVSLIHNGIIENYLELKEELLKEGAHFLSETDSEIAAHLFNRELKGEKNPFRAFQRMCTQLKGSYALLALDTETLDRIFVAKTATPIIVGVGEGEMFVASDVPAVLDYTKKVIVLDDGDVAEVYADRIVVENRGVLIERNPQIIQWDPVTAQKGGYEHFMLKEIYDQVSAVSDTVRGRIKENGEGVLLPDLAIDSTKVAELKRICLTACGTAWHAALLAKFYIEALARIPCDVDYASEFRYRTPPLDSSTLVIAISQSGETADTVAALSLAATICPTVAICNVMGSTLTRKVHGTLYTQAGPEISVASTKAFSTQVVASYLLALWLSSKRGVLTGGEVRELINTLLLVPDGIRRTLHGAENVKRVAERYAASRDYLFLGRGLCYPIALEGALKLKEISYIHAEGYPAGEIKHGPIALIDEKMPVVVLLPRVDELFEKTISNLREVESRGGRIIALTDTDNVRSLHGLCEEIIEVPFISPHWSPLLLNLPLQLLAYYTAVANGADVDLPRNLAKSVTVE